MKITGVQGSTLGMLMLLITMLVSSDLLPLQCVGARNNATLSVKLEKVGSDDDGSKPFYVVNLPMGSPNQTAMRLRLDLEASNTIVRCSGGLTSSSRTFHKLKCPDSKSRKSKSAEGCAAEDSVWLNKLRSNLTDPVVMVPVKKVNFECGGESADGVAGFSGAASSSLPVQVSRNGRLGQKFAYCLPSIAYFGSPDVYTKAQLIIISFNVYSYVQISRLASKEFQRTPLRQRVWRKNGSVVTRYSMSLHNVSVYGSGTNLSKPADIIISTTQRYSALETSVYKAIREGVREFFSGSPRATPIAPFDTCLATYPSAGPHHPLAVGPVVSLHLAGGATWTMAAPRYFVRPKPNLDVTCLALLDAGPRQPNVLGTFQQEGSLLEFDIPRSTLAFKRVYEPDVPNNFLTDCSDLL